MITTCLLYGMCCLSVNGPQDEEHFLLKEASSYWAGRACKLGEQGLRSPQEKYEQGAGGGGRKSDMGQLGI